MTAIEKQKITGNIESAVASFGGIADKFGAHMLDPAMYVCHAWSDAIPEGPRPKRYKRRVNNYEFRRMFGTVALYVESEHAPD